MTKHSKFESERRAAETTRIKEIEAAWVGSLPAETAKSFTTAVEAARARPRSGPQTCRPGPCPGPPGPATSRALRRKSGTADREADLAMKAAPRSPDPVAEPNAYQAMLLALLGDDDPVTVQSATLTELPALIAAAGGALRRPPAPGEWSVVELLGHITDAELVASGRYRWILAQDTPPIPGYDQDRWASRLNHRDADPEELLALHAAPRTANLALWRRTPVDERSRYGIHAERGPESYELTSA